LFELYPDIVTIEQIMSMLNLGKSKVYELLKSNAIRHVRIGNKYIVPKKSVMDLFSDLSYNDTQIVSSGLQNSVMKGATVQC
jgi:excisionase family DNA binding protein